MAASLDWDHGPQPPLDARRARIAVVGGGVSGNLAARLLASDHEVRLYESESYVGGHANTVDVEISGERYPVDTGFMVFNRRTYPNFCRMLELLEISSRESDMSFSVRTARSGLEYEGSDLNGLFAQRRNLLNPRFLGMLRDIVRFNRIATAAVEQDAFESGMTVGDFLTTNGFGEAFANDYFIPMTAAIWSACPRRMLQAPAKFLIGFCRNHGLLQLRDRPRWRTILGGSRRYVQALLEPLGNNVRKGCGAKQVLRSANSVTIVDQLGEAESYDYVVMATHADITLRLLDSPTETEQELLSAFPYQSNEAVLHTDTSLLPRTRRAWASWNYLAPEDPQDTVAVTYDLSRLQGLDSPTPILLTLNRTQQVAESSVLRSFTYDHPVFTVDSIEAQQRLREINGVGRTFFCGAYWGYGFHEDGVNSALAVAKHFGKTLDACTVACTTGGSRTAGYAR